MHAHVTSEAFNPPFNKDLLIHIHPNETHATNNRARFILLSPHQYHSMVRWQTRWSGHVAPTQPSHNGVVVFDQCLSPVSNEDIRLYIHTWHPLDINIRNHVLQRQPIPLACHLREHHQFYLLHIHKHKLIIGESVTDIRSLQHIRNHDQIVTVTKVVNIISKADDLPIMQHDNTYNFFIMLVP